MKTETGLTVRPKSHPEDVVHKVCCMEHDVSVCGLDMSDGGPVSPITNDPTCHPCSVIVGLDPYYCPIGLDCRAIEEMGD